MFEGLEFHRRGHLKALWAAGVMILLLISLLPKELLDVEPPFSDKILHFLAYLAVTLPGSLAASSVRRMLFVGFGMVLLGSFIEVLQNYVPGRSPELLDGLANLAGVVAGLALADWLRRQ